MRLARSTRAYRPIYRIDNVIHGTIRPLSQPSGSWVSGVYPSGGTQLNRNVPWSLLWVIRFATSPSQNTGMEIPISARIISSGSSRVPRSTAAPTPITTAITTQITAAPNTSDNVAGAAAAISGTTSWPWLE
jgi:hypothetical protein